MLKIFHAIKLRTNDSLPSMLMLIMRMCFNFVYFIFVLRIEYENISTTKIFDLWYTQLCTYINHVSLSLSAFFSDHEDVLQLGHAGRLRPAGGHEDVLQLGHAKDMQDSSVRQAAMRTYYS